MKLAVISFSGNVGKTTIARHLLAPRIPGAKVLSIESINADEAQEDVIRGRQFAELQEYLQVFEDVVVDIGASNVEELLALMRRYRGSHEDFDAFVVPTVAARKQQLDTIATLAELSRLGIAPHKVRLVFNMVEDDAEFERVFEPVLAFLRHSPVAEVSLDCRLGVNEIYARAHGAGVDLSSLAADSTDYKAAIVRAGSTAEKVALAQKLATQRLARGVVPELDACFAALDLPARVVLRESQSPNRKPRAMTGSTTAREVLIAEALGEVARVVDRVEAVTSGLDDACRSLRQADSHLREALAGFESRMAAITENAKAVAVRHVATHVDATTRRTIDLQTRAMAEAARVAFGAELGATLQRLQATLGALMERQTLRWDLWRWELWATHAAAAFAASAATAAVTTHLLAH